jgi:succinoglycan biosynthesis protein ExoM
MKTPLISVCICTFMRMHLLDRLFESLSRQKTEERFRFSLVVVDNDREASARTTVSESASRFHLPVTYDVEPDRNFSLVRNRAVKNALGDFVAFIDDDELPVEHWLLDLHRTAEKHDSDAVLGPVRPYFDATPPKWLRRSGLCERPSYRTGTRIPWEETRSGNVLLRKTIFDQKGVWFDPRYDTGGEDKDFFKRAAGAGGKFVWCEEAAVYELVPVERQRRAYYLKRALLQGAISLKYDGLGDRGRLARVCVRTVIAASAYTLLLPFFLFCGMHTFMKYLVKDCHHVGRLSAILGVPLVKTRNF